MKHKDLNKVLKSLFWGELTACLVFVFCLFSLKRSLKISIDTIILYPFLILLFVLLQGSYYWFYRFKKSNKKKSNVKLFQKTYRILRTFDLVLLVIYPIIMMIYFLIKGYLFFEIEVFLGLFIYIFSIAEYVNYFYIRLSYSKYNDIVAVIKLQNLRKSSLSKELKR